jgi:glutaredoxin
MKINFYSQPTCTQCTVLKRQMDEAGINFEVIEEVSEMQRLGIMSVPTIMFYDEWKGYVVATLVKPNFSDLQKKN